MSEQHKQEPETPVLTRTQVLIAMGVTAIILWIVAKVWVELGNFSILPCSLDEQKFFLGVSLGFLITCLSGIAYRFWDSYKQSADYYLEIVLKPLAFPDLIWLGLLPGLSEELLFRGVMLSAFGASHPAIFVSSICFGVLHLSSPQQWPYVIWATVVGVILGYSAVMSGNLLVPIVAHITTNLASSYFWKIRRR